MQAKIKPSGWNFHESLKENKKFYQDTSELLAVHMKCL